MLLRFLLIAGLSWSCSAEQPTADMRLPLPDVVDFNFHVKPILSDRCFKCHGPDEAKRDAGLGLHEEAAAFAALGDAKDHFAIVPGKPEQSTLIARIYSADPTEAMPPPESNLSLSEWEKAVLKKWIAQGAEWKAHWAFTPPVAPAVPAAGAGWAVNDIDRFLYEKMEENGLAPAPMAEKSALLRRLSFDLRGLPPTSEELQAFEADNRPGAWAEWAGRFLDTDDYAERMALDWMDLARYADTHGYQDDFERTMWPWRDWVIHAFRENMPYDKFVIWQLAGDLLPSPTKEQLLATGFNRNHKITAEGGVIDEEYRVEYVADRVQTFGTAFLGLTMDCARCHDHKYDPISQKDYFSLFGYFNNVPERGYVSELNQNARFAPEPSITISKEEIDNILTFINNKEELESLDLMVMAEKEERRPTFVLKRGQYDQYGEQVSPAIPKAFNPDGFSADNRLELARWLFQPGNPLTARVAVNRIWQQFFGQGLVSTPFDFGNQGALPTHPELLDYLAVRFRESGWDIQALIRLIVESAAYRQSAVTSSQKLAADPGNQWLARAPRLRLKGEMIRDQALASSGLLVREVGGPSVKPYQPEGLWEETTGGGGGSTARYVQGEGDDLYRKSLYTFWKRTVPPPGMLIFDAPSRDLCTVERQETNTPLQALLLMNDPAIVEASQVLAARAWRKAEGEPGAAIKWMYRAVTSSLPDAEELEQLLQLFEQQQEVFAEAPLRAKQYVGAGAQETAHGAPLAVHAALAFVGNTILNLDVAINRG